MGLKVRLYLATAPQSSMMTKVLTSRSRLNCTTTFSQEVVDMDPSEGHDLRAQGENSSQV